ncbi:BatD family protein [Roseibium polysiphoniae]|uniref:BatD family protein n=1 Tax=Roseibium polysiphoniae TaxID=2571221 RepID=A0ABR9CC94_9HYPH|nr:BatD family protein [Roseibium polysiphoniae]MBD8877500.1 BatD family protein [Roseibium polysiphoniae]
MIRVLFILCCLLFAAPSQAQQADTPLVRTSLDTDTAIPGQPLVFRVTILVPTWMPTPPVFPSFEAHNVVVRLPSRASSPTSETVNGETWSGIARAYRLYPMVPGTFQVPGGPIKITYADPETREPIVANVDVSPFEITGEAPETAKNLKPFLAANALSLARQVEGTPESLTAGDALKVTTTIKVTGVAPMFVPPIKPGEPIEGLSVYPASPVLNETENRGEQSGTRTETLTIVAENAGTYQIPAETLSWYDLENEKIETASVPAIELSVTGPAAAAGPEQEEFDWAHAAIRLLFVFVLLGLLTILIRKVGPQFSARMTAFLAHQTTTEQFAFRKFKRALQKQDYALTLKWLKIWQERLDGPIEVLNWTPIETSCSLLGRYRFGAQDTKVRQKPDKAWKTLLREAQELRRRSRLRRHVNSKENLSPLNPSSSRI